MDLTEVRDFIENKLQQDGDLVPLLIRFSWHCCGTFDKNRNNGGSNGGTMRFETERNDPENSGFKLAFDLFDELKEKVKASSEISFADLYILGGYVAIEYSGGPVISFKTGRIDFDKQNAQNIYGHSGCPFGDGDFNSCGSRLPTADCGQDDTKDKIYEREKKTIEAMRGTFNRLGFVDREAVALILLGHQYGQGHLDVSGYDGFWFPFAPNYWNIPKSSNGGGYFSIYKNIHKLKEATTLKGKRQWETTIYGRRKIMLLPTDMAIYWDLQYRSHLQFYDKNRHAFFHEAKSAWQKLTELGCDGLLTPEKRIN